MKEQLSVLHPSSSLLPISTGEQKVKNIHCRGDKVVVNGAKQSLLAILRKYKCGCDKHNFQKLTTKFLSSNKITASYDIIVWMLMYVQSMTEFSIYSQILQKYLQKMNNKYSQKETHQSPEYVESKKQTLKKFIKSAQVLNHQDLTYNTFQKSIYQLYSKPKSAQNASTKLKNFLRSGKLPTANSCFLKFKDETKKTQQKNQERMQQENKEIQSAQSHLEQVYSKQESNENEQIQESTQVLIHDQISSLFDGHRTSSKVSELEGFSFTQLKLLPEKSSYSSGDLFNQLLEENQLCYFG